MIKTEAYYAGYNSSDDDACPYKSDSNEWREWFAGQTDSETDREPNDDYYN